MVCQTNLFQKENACLSLKIYINTYACLDCFGPKRLTKIMACENALHGMICCVPGRCGSTLITSGAKVIVIAYQTFVAPPTKIRIQTCVTAHTCKISYIVIFLYNYNVQADP